MQTALITGGTGCLGANLALEIRRRGMLCRVLRRPQSNRVALENIDVGYFDGDVRNRGSLVAAMQGCDIVFHTAAIVSFWKHLRQVQYDVNVLGTRNVVEAALETNVRRLVHTSSVAAIGFRTDGELINETTPYNWGPDIGYRYSKHLAEKEILTGVAKGLDAVILNPSVIIGPRDVHVHGGQFVRDIAKRKIPAYLDGGLNVVSVRDVVSGHLAAAECGRTGERYILGGTNYTHKDFFQFLAGLLLVPPPRLRAPLFLVRGIARICDLFGDIARRQPWITSELMSGAGMRNWYSIEKARLELAYVPTSLEDAVLSAAAWFRDHNML